MLDKAKCPQCDNLLYPLPKAKIVVCPLCRYKHRREDLKEVKPALGEGAIRRILPGPTYSKPAIHPPAIRAIQKPAIQLDGVKRVQRNFRITEEVASRIERIATMRGISQGALIEQLVLSAQSGE